MDAMDRVTAIYEYDPVAHVWYARVAEDERAHTYGRTLAKAREHLAEAAALWFDEGFEWGGERIVLPSDGDAVDRARRDREEAAQAMTRARATQHEAARKLMALGLSARDAAGVLGISHPRLLALLKEVA
jgi:predicted RNase H-like HicB family nuclease